MLPWPCHGPWWGWCGAHVLVHRVLVMCARDILSTLIFPFTTLPNISTVMAGPFITTTLARSAAQRHTRQHFSLFLLTNDIYVINKGLVSWWQPAYSGPHGMFWLLTSSQAPAALCLCVGGIIAPSPPTRAPGFILFPSWDNKLWTSLLSSPACCWLSSGSLMRPLAWKRTSVS